jgi:ornithine cyclodeaminase/alanine dehydrogenase-like protein (mu-crystallin family)
VEIIDAATVVTRLKPRALVSALQRMFRDGCTAPARHHHTVHVPGAPDATLLLMPAWRDGAYLGIKLVTVFPGNASRALPAVSAAYVLMDANTGVIRALIDGAELTARRTAATSALAAQYLARQDATSLLVIGTGRIAHQLARFHVALRPKLTAVRVWGRTPGHARSMVDELARDGIPSSVATDLPAAIAASDIVSAATLTATPLINGRWVRPGTHVDLVGGYTPAMREGDDALIERAQVFVDTRDGALIEAGDIVAPMARGLLTADSVHDLHDLSRGTHPGRTQPDEITVFKSVGAALEDLAAAIEVFEFPGRAH